MAEKMTSNSDITGNFCRLCEDSRGPMQSIFSKNSQGVQILNLIKLNLPLIVFRTDPLPKQVCLRCLETLEAFHYLRTLSTEVAERQLAKLRSLDKHSTSVQLYLALQENEQDHDEVPAKLECSCHNNNWNEDKPTARKTRRRSQAFYHELEDSLCSSVSCTEDGAQYNGEDGNHSESDSYASNARKRRKLDNGIVEKPMDLEVFHNLYRDEEEYLYQPFNLLTLALNKINERIDPLHDPGDFYRLPIKPNCTVCQMEFGNSKLLALHQIQHVNVTLGDRIDDPLTTFWDESSEETLIRTKWLQDLEINGEKAAKVVAEEEPEVEEEDDVSMAESLNESSLLIPVERPEPALIQQPEENDEDRIVLVNGIATVNGIALSDYSKDQRKVFYKSIRIGTINRKFCPLCRFSFKDNWAIESHYFSLACNYTCRYCGMRYNKQRHCLDDHVRMHLDRGDKLATKVFTPNKNNNYVPKDTNPPEHRSRKSQSQHAPPPPPPPPPPHSSSTPTNTMTTRRSSASHRVVVKEEVPEKNYAYSTVGGVGGKTTNQAYFCRKCYKVFFELDKFNVHSKKCETNGTSTTPVTVTPTGRPVRNCVRELKEEVAQQNFVCFICNTPFPTIYSRNSHMRIHKGETNNKIPPQHSSRNSSSKSTTSSQNKNQSRNSMYESGHFMVKQEPLEPEVEIHESEQHYNTNSTTSAAVSITPISKNPNQRPTINANIMRLVQNNPHLTIRTSKSPEKQNTASNSNNVSGSPESGDKTYKCSSCWANYTNKSRLYFHKKNECEGSKYPCPFCKKRFGTEAAYSSHIFYSHPE